MEVYILHFTPDDKIEISPFYCSQCWAKKNPSNVRSELREKGS